MPAKKKTITKKTPAKKKVTKKVTTKKAPVKKVTTKKAPVKKAPVKKNIASSKKVTKKTPSKKVSTVKRKPVRKTTLRKKVSTKKVNMEKNKMSDKIKLTEEQINVLNNMDITVEEFQLLSIDEQKENLKDIGVPVVEEEVENNTVEKPVDKPVKKDKTVLSSEKTKVVEKKKTPLDVFNDLVAKRQAILSGVIGPKEQKAIRVNYLEIIQHIHNCNNIKVYEAAIKYIKENLASASPIDVVISEMRISAATAKSLLCLASAFGTMASNAKYERNLELNDSLIKSEIINNKVRKWLLSQI